MNSLNTGMILSKTFSTGDDLIDDTGQNYIVRGIASLISCYLW